MKIPPFKLERYFAEYEFSTPFLLCSSDCETFSIQDLLNLEEDSTKSFLQLPLGYTESQGASELRKQIASLYESISLEQILVHTGAEEAIFLFMNAMFTKEDHLIVHFPCYQSLFEIAKSIGCEISFWNTSSEKEWELEINDLEKLIQPNTKAVVLNSPHNPTGYQISKTKLHQLNQLAQEQKFIVFSDEVYRFLEYKTEDQLPAFCDLNSQSVSLGVLSKSFGLAGLRLGWIATKNHEVYEKMAALKDYTTICNSAPSEYLGAIAIKHKDKLIARNKNIVLENLELLKRFMEDYQDIFQWVPPKAGPITFPSFISAGYKANFHQKLIEEAGVLLLPGNLYHSRFEKHFRIGFGRKNFPQGLAKLKDFLEKR